MKKCCEPGRFFDHGLLWLAVKAVKISSENMDPSHRLTIQSIRLAKKFREVIFPSDLRLRLLLEKRYPQEHRFTEPMSFDN